MIWSAQTRWRGLEFGSLNSEVGILRHPPLVAERVGGNSKSHGVGGWHSEFRIQNSEFRILLVITTASSPSL